MSEYSPSSRYGPLSVVLIVVVAYIYAYGYLLPVLYPDIPTLLKNGAFAVLVAYTLYASRKDWGWYKNGFARLVGGAADIEVTAQGFFLRRRVFSQHYLWDDVDHLEITMMGPDTGERDIDFIMNDGKRIELEDNEKLIKLKQIQKWSKGTLSEKKPKMVRIDQDTGLWSEVDGSDNPV